VLFHPYLILFFSLNLRPVFSDKTTENDLHQIADGYSLIQPDLIKIGTNISIATSNKIASEVKAVKEFILKFVQVSISKFGLIQ